ncbi:hypothetical protein [Chryseobacterium lathyri]|uniref:Uncharacterized protein n=1 Tax=Chryseobacterium lathyri TaxID=395933 RepID=A0ABT9SQC9_9FLAO|nr:hypothetical protein [Chryseobacterium lathyri]MDP9961641.1 hypothetical protein [Chryseobacterium lathyri]
MPKQNTQFVIPVGNLTKWFDKVNPYSLDSFRMTKKWQKKSLENSNDFK